MQKFVIRSSTSPAWLRQIEPSMGVPWREYEVTEDERLAHQFFDKTTAERIAWLWSDVPGVWEVVDITPRVVSATMGNGKLHQL
jgi:hypothetical protein